MVDDEHEAIIEIPPSKNRRGSGVRAEKLFNRDLEQNFRYIHSKSRRTKKILAWDFYETFYVDSKETGLKWYFCTICYSKQNKMKEGMTGMILYNKRNTHYFSNYVVTLHKRVFYHFFLH